MTVSILLCFCASAFTSVSAMNIINTLHLLLIVAVTLAQRHYCFMAQGEQSCISGHSVIHHIDWPCLCEGALYSQLRQFLSYVLWESDHFPEIHQMHGIVCVVCFFFFNYFFFSAPPLFLFPSLLTSVPLSYSQFLQRPQGISFYVSQATFSSSGTQKTEYLLPHVERQQLQSTCPATVQSKVARSGIIIKEQSLDSTSISLAVNQPMDSEPNSLICHLPGVQRVCHCNLP